MQTLARGRVLFVVASLLLVAAGCAHRGETRYPPSDAFFTNPPPDGVLTPAQAGPGDPPPPRQATHAEPAAAAQAKAPAPVGAAAAPAAAAPGATTTSAAAGASAGAAASSGAAAPAAAAAATAAAATAVAKPSSAAADTAHLWPKTTANVHVDELPVAVTRVPPSYPDAARAAGTQGTVQLQALVKTDGTVGDVRVTVSVPGLDEAAMACVRKWTFKPGQAGGKPVEAWVGVPVRFSLH